MMINVSIVGFGGHVKKNILPVLVKIPRVKIVSIYVRNVELAKSEMAVLDYDIDIKHLEAPLDKAVTWVYIATPISTHYQYAMKYLNLGVNVICEKSLSEDYKKILSMFSMAEKKGLSLVEVQMYKYHKEYEHLKNNIAKKIQHLKYVETEFSIPELPDLDIRYNKELCGGALLDVGYYPISILIDLFGEPKSTYHYIYGEAGREVDTNGIMIFDYEHFYCSAKWAIGKTYDNHITISGNNVTLKYNRIFSKPSNLVTKLIIDEFNVNGQQTIEIGSDDQFKNFFEEVFFNGINKDILKSTKLTLKLLTKCYDSYYKSR
jgi:NDP-hexose-3-ketoreductase